MSGNCPRIMRPKGASRLRAAAMNSRKHGELLSGSCPRSVKPKMCRCYESAEHEFEYVVEATSNGEKVVVDAASMTSSGRRRARSRGGPVEVRGRVGGTLCRRVDRQGVNDAEGGDEVG